MSDRVLTPQQLRDLTGRTHRRLQRRELDRMGVPYRVRSDGSVATTWTAVNGALMDDRREVGPDWGALP